MNEKTFYEKILESSALLFACISLAVIVCTVVCVGMKTGVRIIMKSISGEIDE